MMGNEQHDTGLQKAEKELHEVKHHTDNHNSEAAVLVKKFVDF
jgi:hypothetical protein